MAFTGFLSNRANVSELGPDIAESLVAVCQQHASAIAQSLAAAFDLQDVQLAVAEQQQMVTMDHLAGKFHGAGLAVSMQTVDSGAMLLMPATVPWLPAWYASPDVSGRQRLQTLATQLPPLLFPESVSCVDSIATPIADLTEAIRDARLLEPGCLVVFEATSDEVSGILALLWPVANPLAIARPGEAAAGTSWESDQSDSKPDASHSSTSTTVGEAAGLPPYCRSLMKIQVPVVVSLAAKKERVSDILQLGPGAIIQFDKSCEEMLELEVGNGRIAQGEAVKVGDKFGIRITSVALPGERFNAVRRQKEKSE